MRRDKNLNKHKKKERKNESDIKKMDGKFIKGEMKKEQKKIEKNLLKEREKKHIYSHQQKGNFVSY